ncbi:hypothetical protein [Endozoicomonas arenosclerae]|uniref:hypothetical protein n=1 Tax=Endozoicomonas arenosclerae TaxID=1633495 RepID=UPI000AEA48FD|nr:hypothetical protein [Endozoicomonas arenosclerae]
MRKITLTVLLLVTQLSFAEGFHYCSGKITDIVTRATSEVTKVSIEGMTGWASLGYGGDQYKEMHDRQFSMLLSAYMAGKPVTLEFLDSSMSCDSNHDSMQIRYVRVRG